MKIIRFQNFRLTPVFVLASLFVRSLSAQIAPNEAGSDAPFADITNGLVQARLYLPDAERGYYRATRFDWSGIIGSLTADGHSYFGRWFAKYDPKLHDSISGPVEEFVTGQGFEKAKTGETFVKIGVGVLRKPENPSMRGFPTLEIVTPGKWTTHVHKDSVEFIHEVEDPASGYGYRYRKLVSLPPGKAQLILEQRIEATGPNPIDTDVYDHNFFVIDGQPSGPDFDVQFPFALTASADVRGLLDVRGNHVTYVKELDSTQRVLTRLNGFGDSPTDYDIRVENHKTGAGVRVTSDHPLSRVVFWSAHTVLSPEAYIHVHAERGQPMTWKIVYDFYSIQH